MAIASTATVMLVLLMAFSKMPFTCSGAYTLFFIFVDKLIRGIAVNPLDCVFSLLPRYDEMVVEDAISCNIVSFVFKINYVACRHQMRRGKPVVCLYRFGWALPSLCIHQK